MSLHQGVCDPSYGAVSDAFDSIVDRTRGGAAFCAIVDGRTLVNMHGGFAGPSQTRPWLADTAATVFSGSKGLVSMCLALLVDRGELDIDAHVSRYWPQFAAGGKETITVREVACHRAGLPALAVSPSVKELVDPQRAASLLADQQPHPRLAGVPCYHALTFGWLCAEVVRRVSGQSLGEFFRCEIAEAAGADVHFGLPSPQHARVADIFISDGWQLPEPQFDPAYARRIYGEPELWTAGELAWNLPEVRSAEIAGAGAIGTAEAMARCYAACAEGLDGRGPIVSAQTLDLFTTDQYDEAVDPCFGDPLRFGVGFQLQAAPMFFGPPVDAFGHGGAGGSSHGWWPSHRVAFSFVMNEMLDETQDHRGRDLLSALYDCVR
jgi:CubicO group peptidase (beta-lactamase class C family)